MSYRRIFTSQEFLDYIEKKAKLGIVNWDDFEEHYRRYLVEAWAVYEAARHFREENKEVRKRPEEFNKLIRKL